MRRQALESYQRAIHEDPTNSLLRAYLAELYFEEGDIEKAFSEFDQATTLVSVIDYVYASYANLLFQAGRYEKSVEVQKTADELDRTEAEKNEMPPCISHP